MLTMWPKLVVRTLVGAVVLVAAVLLMPQSALADHTALSVGDNWFCNESFQGDVCLTTIHVGNPIDWDFSGASVAHTTTACGASCDDPTDSPLWDSGVVVGDSTFRYRFRDPGTYLYYCELHPTQQRGVIVVIGKQTHQPPTPTAISPVATLPPPGSTGDVNCNGSVDSIDAALVLQLTAGLVSSLSCDQNADVNEDGTTNSIDAALILQFSAGLIPTLPA